MICSNCGTENAFGRKFCDQCGTRLATGCPSCGSENRPGARFCAECGTPLGAAAATAPTVAPAERATSPAPAAERRLVSVLFADLVGFTALAEGRDAEAVRELLTRYFELAREVVERYGGVVEKFIGDAVMAVWGTPTAHEDDAERSVRAALELVDAVRTLGPELEARAGVLSGEAAVTLGATGQGMVAGDLVNTASRLQAVAPAGAVLVGEATQRAASAAIVFESAGEQALKGKASPVPAFRALRVVAERRGAGRSERLEAPFVGRAEELRLLKELFHATSRERRTRLVSITGQAGIGKSRLAWEFLKYIDGLVETVYWHEGRSPAYGEGITFWALGEMVRSRAKLLETDDEPTTRSKVAETLATYVPDEAERRWIEPPLLALLGVEGAPPGGREELFAAWRTLFERIAARGTVALVLEDLQWADVGLLDFIDHVLEWSRGVPICIITLARPELLERRPDWGAGKRNFTSISLEPLPESAMRDLLAGLVPGLPESAVRAIVDRADGVPLYAIETVRMLVAEGRLAEQDGAYRPAGDLTSLAVPETLHALIAARLDALDPADRSLLQDAAVLGQSFTVAAVAAVTGIDPAQLEPRLRSLVRRDLLELEVDPLSPERGQYAFVQALVREVAYATLGKRERRSRHLAAARYFEALGEDELAGALATHYLDAYRAQPDGPEADATAAQARVAMRAAADRAAALGSPEQALAYIEQAIDITSDPTQRAELLERAGRSARVALRTETAEQYVREAIELHRANEDRARVAGATADLASVLLEQARPEPAIALLQEARNELDDLADTPAAAALMSTLARAYSRHEEPLLALEWAEQALAVAERLDLVGIIAESLLSRAGSLAQLHRSREALVLLKGVSEFALTNDLPEIEMRARTILTFALQWDDPRAGVAAARAGLDIARRIGSRQYGLLMIGNGMSCAFRAGEWDWAVAVLDEWLASDLGPADRIELTADRAIIEACRGGDPAGLLAAIEPLLGGLTDPQYDAYRQMSRAWSALTAGRLDDAHDAARTAAATSSLFAAVGLPLAARAALWARDGTQAMLALEALVASGVHGSAVDADRRTLRAGLAAHHGRIAEGVGAYREALRNWHDLGLPWDQALCAIDMVTLLGPDDPDARAASDEAREILARLGARPFVARLEAALERQPTTPEPTPDAERTERAAAV